MKIPRLEKKPEIKSCHNTKWKDDYSWIHQKNILEVLKDSSKLVPEVRKYLEEENYYTDFHLSNTKDIQKNYLKKLKVVLNLTTNLFPTKIIIMNIGIKQQLKATISLN